MYTNTGVLVSDKLFLLFYGLSDDGLFLSALSDNAHGQADRQLFFKTLGSSTLQVRRFFQVHRPSIDVSRGLELKPVTWWC